MAQRIQSFEIGHLPRSARRHGWQSNAIMRNCCPVGRSRSCQTDGIRPTRGRVAHAQRPSADDSNITFFHGIATMSHPHLHYRSLSS